MKMDHMILYIIYACTFMSLAYIPKSKWREASIAFLFQQFITWSLGLIPVEYHLLEYPVRELPDVNGTSFLFEFLVYPIIGVFFCIHYPRTKTLWRKFIYISGFCTVLTISEVLFEKYTDLIRYLHWDWYVSWLSIYATLYVLWVFYSWYFKLNRKT
ncbi:CBO0543 family protein [Bacillus sp. JJ1566]|uniref:CBO0543 family protein n=1 Tax=Bacillus sp. JJ1566 TaxID=3122961 RepID=UPI002FFDD5C0